MRRVRRRSRTRASTRLFDDSILACSCLTLQRFRNGLGPARSIFPGRKLRRPPRNHGNCEGLLRIFVLSRIWRLESQLTRDPRKVLKHHFLSIENSRAEYRSGLSSVVLLHSQPRSLLVRSIAISAGTLETADCRCMQEQSLSRCRGFRHVGPDWRKM